MEAPGSGIDHAGRRIDLTITGTLSRSAVQGPCVWCGGLSTSRALAPGIGREVPIHILCCARVVQAARRWIERGEESPEWRAYAGRLEALGSGE